MAATHLLPDPQAVACASTSSGAPLSGMRAFSISRCPPFGGTQSVLFAVAAGRLILAELGFLTVTVWMCLLRRFALVATVVAAVLRRVPLHTTPDPGMVGLSGTPYVVRAGSRRPPNRPLVPTGTRPTATLAHPADRANERNRYKAPGSALASR